MTILVLNAGSSTLKFAAYGQEDGLTLRFKDQVQGAGAPALAALFERLSREGIEARDLIGVGHRIVHGGTEFSKPVLVDDAIEAKLNALRPLAPLLPVLFLPGAAIWMALDAPVAEAACSSAESLVEVLPQDANAQCCSRPGRQ